MQGQMITSESWVLVKSLSQGGMFGVHMTWWPKVTNRYVWATFTRTRTHKGEGLRQTEDEFDLIEAKYGGVNEQVVVRVYIRDLDKNEVEVLTI